MINELGNSYGRLTVIDYAGKKRNGNSHVATWLCSCECGTTVVVRGSDLRKGNTLSCGCLHKDRTRKANTVHGDTPKGKPHARLYRIWANMNTRCSNPNNAEYNSYGGKGVRNEFKDYPAFKDWAYRNGYHDQPEGTPKAELLSIDRIDPSKGYSPDNCRWVSLSENAKRRNVDYWSKKHGNPSGSPKKDTRNDYEVK